METKVRKHERLQCWTGSPEELRRADRTIAHDILKLADALGYIPPEEREPKPEFGWRGIEADITPRVSATTADGALEFNGELDEVLAESDHRRLKNLVMKAAVRDGYETIASVTVTLTLRESSMPGVDIEAEGTDYTWVTGLTTALLEQLRPGVPRWAPIRTGKGAIAACLFLAAITIVPMFLIPQVIPNIVFLVTIAAITLHPLFYDRWFPSFEIVTVGGRSTGSRNLASAAVLIGLILGAASILIALFAETPSA